MITVIFKHHVPFVMGNILLGLQYKNCFYIPLKFRSDVYLYRYNICEHPQLGCVDSINAVQLIKMNKSKSIKTPGWLWTNIDDGVMDSFKTALAYYDHRNKLSFMFSFSQSDSREPIKLDISNNIVIDINFKKIKDAIKTGRAFI